ncbi:uncharacterized ATP-dependent helicase C29A10.10c isoform X2 [Lactuca sativa]|uniref:AAA+ ATPase domain-containing protein n=1 Tax=Lactuca sativa TaxID=4236 RepID=A0A9R1X7L9_LACSA|nr:uncharacterized ATP-dependent helicase C29A10.10c isoform X2 [Lactuca sativa]KAJ0201729.1 hypothetical protein LSAT_V11C600336940 [Lactuca sativa]
MGSREKPLFDLNEPAVEDESDTVPSTINTCKLSTSASSSSHKTVNTRAFSHVSSVSSFQPFIQSKREQPSEVGEDLKKEAAKNILEKEEGEWSDVEDPSIKTNRTSSSIPEMSTSGYDEKSQTKATTESESTDQNDCNLTTVSSSTSSKNENNNHTSKLPIPTNPGKRPKLDQQKEAMLGKKRSRQTMFLNMEDVKQAGPIKILTPKKHNFQPPIVTRIVKESRPVLDSIKEAKPIDQSCNEGNNNHVESSDTKSDCNESDLSSGPVTRSRRTNSGTDLAGEDKDKLFSDHIHRQSSFKQPNDSRQMKNPHIPIKKPPLNLITQNDSKSLVKKLPSRKPTTVTTLYQDTSVERLLREVTNDKFWQHPEDADLQRVPGSFESVEEYIRVFEPLLFEECRAQLYSTWEESTETSSRDSHTMVRIKNVERRERGWYDVILLPTNECRWNFKEGDVAVLSTPKPGTVRLKRNNAPTNVEESEVIGRVAGTVRRHIPIDTRDPTGATLHFYVGDSFDSNSDDDHILKKLHPKGVWFLTILGALATTQREYIALHAFRRLNSQMQTAILQPSPEQFPKYEEQAPSMPECFTTNFVDYLHHTFNQPQLSAIHWAAMHTAAGTTNTSTKRQDPWPFTLVQGPPGTGKTHTVWGMLNVIHLVQYQHYYTALLKKLAPESYKQATESLSSENAPTGSIDQVLQNMDQNLFRTLHKICPKPRMLVCAPSNAATDELLTRVLERGFIDGEMKMYRPDVARVGVDSNTRAAQAVSVERRTEQLLMKSRDEVYGWINQLRAREAQLSQQIASLQRQLNLQAYTGRAEGSVGVDPDILTARDQTRDSFLQNLAAVVENRDKVLVEMSRLLILEPRFHSGNFNLEEARASLEASFANEAEIVFTTVSSSGRKLFSRLTHGFDMVVIDEAAQASEVGVLPPLSLGAARCVLVGDPQQLPATVISKAAGTLLYSRSLFERFQQAGCPTILLSVQYRMHPQIRDFPSRYFYQGRLTDSESVKSQPDENYYNDPLLRPYVFYDVTHGRESHRGGSVSYQNVHEAKFCVRLYERLMKVVGGGGGGGGVGKVTVGVITPYKLQLKCIQREFEEVLRSDEGKDIYINTVDAFQGQERDVIIMSCVRASSYGVGFVADIRRMNVALTRAKRALWVMGNASALVQSEDWAALIADAKARKCYMDMDSLPKDFLAAPPLPPPPPAYGPPPPKFSNSRGFMRPNFRNRPYEHMGTPSGDESKTNSNSNSSRNGNSYRPFNKPPLEDNHDWSRDSWQQYGAHKRPNQAGVLGKRDQ